MKRISTFVCKALLALTILSSNISTAFAQCIAPAMKHENGVLVSGTAGLNDALVVLPVRYLSFNAVVVEDKSVDLKWITDQEINNGYFEIERSLDMNNFKTIGLVLDGFKINGNVNSYVFLDNSTDTHGKSIVYYTIKQIDVDNNVSYSKVLPVKFQANGVVVMQVSPNPFVENLSVRFNSSEKGMAEIRLISSTGQTILSKQSFISKGYNNLQLDGLSNLNTGMYAARLVMNGALIDNQKIIKN